MAISDYDAFDDAKKAGALHLLPENADYYAELVRISAVVGSLSPAQVHLPRIPDYLWREWINSSEPMHRAPEMGGDPAEGPFVVEIACFGGGYLTIPAANPEDPFILSCLLQAIFQIADGDRGTFRHESACIALLGLWLSDRCVRAAGLCRNVRPDDTSNDEIRWPHSEIARQLENAVTISTGELAAKMFELGVGVDGLSTIAFDAGQISLNYNEPRANPVCRRPFLISDDHVVVISPSTIVPALRDALLEIAAAHALQRVVADAYQEVVHARLREHADLQRWIYLNTRDSISSTCRVRESLFQIDSDKIAAVYALCDDLRTSSTRDGGTWWDLDATAQEIESRISATEQELFALDKAPCEILHVVVVQGIGRHYGFRLSRSTNPLTTRLILSADEFVIFSLLNMNDCISLWRVARAKDRLPSHFGMIGGFLDHYAVFRNRQGSYYFTDDGAPDFVALSATGSAVRFEAHERLDPHVVRTADHDKFGKVLRLQSKSDFPVYAIQPIDRQRVQLLVEGYPFPIWVGQKSVVTTPGNNFGHLYFHLADAIAFWIWQLTSSLRGVFDRSTHGLTQLTLFVSIRDPHEWLCDMSPSNSTHGIEVSRVDESSLLFDFSREFAAHASIADNVAERELARLIVNETSALVEVPLTTIEVDAIIDRDVPLGEKRRFVILSGRVEEIVNTEGLPSFRTIQSFDEQALADALGTHIRDGLKLDVGNISDERNYDQWQIVPLMVLDSDLISPRLIDPPFPIILADELTEFLSGRAAT